MNKRHYEHTLPNIRGSLSNTYSLCDEAQNFIVVVEDNWGNMTEMEFDFNDAGDEETGTVEDSLSVQEGGAL